jgi:hypothetical protein
LASLIVVTTLFVLRSTREIEPSPAFSVQTAPSPVAIDRGDFPTAMMPSPVTMV